MCLYEKSGFIMNRVHARYAQVAVARTQLAGGATDLRTGLKGPCQAHNMAALNSNGSVFLQQ